MRYISGLDLSLYTRVLGRFMLWFLWYCAARKRVEIEIETEIGIGEK